jgi:phosphatidylinositol-3-phosphatase
MARSRAAHPPGSGRERVYLVTMGWTFSRRLVAACSAACLLAAAAGGSTALSTGRAQVPRIAHVVLIVFENHERSSVLGSGAAPTFDALAAQYAQATDYHAIAHPSLPNYLALISGSTHGVTGDCLSCPQTGSTIGSQLTSAGRRWGAFAEGYPRGAHFDKKHVPFLYFAHDAAHVRPLGAFTPTALPAFSFITPNRCHDMHDCSVSTGDAWLRGFVKPLLKRPSTAIFIVFDEGTTTAGGGGLVPLIVAGSAVQRRTTITQTADHYSLLRTIEDALGLSPLGYAADATPLTGIWRG